MNGTISSIEGHGSIVIIWIDPKDGESRPVYLDHRAFGWLVEGDGVGTVGDLIGRPVSFDGEAIEFLDTLEAA